MKHPMVDEDHERPLYATFEKVISTDDSEKNQCVKSILSFFSIFVEKPTRLCKRFASVETIK